MIISGHHKFNESPSTLWKMLNDPDVLVKITPGIKSLEPTGNGSDEYIAISEIRIGPVRGSFEGTLALRDKVENTRTSVVIDQKSKIGNVSAEITLILEAESDNTTTIKYEGNAKLSGMLASMGQRIVGGVVSTLSKQFFTSLEQILEKNHKQ